VNVSVHKLMTLIKRTSLMFMRRTSLIVRDSPPPRGTHPRLTQRRSLTSIALSRRGHQDEYEIGKEWMGSFELFHRFTFDRFDAAVGRTV
jgi:hypothetical protein